MLLDFILSDHDCYGVKSNSVGLIIQELLKRVEKV